VVEKNINNRKNIVSGDKFEGKWKEQE